MTDPRVSSSGATTLVGGSSDSREITACLGSVTPFCGVSLASVNEELRNVAKLCLVSSSPSETWLTLAADGCSARRSVEVIEDDATFSLFLA
jgi:hypothetical protein